MALHGAGCGATLSAALFICSVVGGGANLNMFVDRAEVHRITGKSTGSEHDTRRTLDLNTLRTAWI